MRILAAALAGFARRSPISSRRCARGRLFSCRKRVIVANTVNAKSPTISGWAFCF